MPINAVSHLPVPTGPFAEETTTTQDLVDGLLTPIRVRAGRTLIAEGSVGREFFVIAEGRAEVRRDGEVMNELGPGDYFGELALLGEARRTASVVAVTDMQVMVANPREFRALLEISPRFARSLEQTVTDRRLALAS
ncbi:MAG: cyclic nucleotide-binding domain-containing protein [Acidimicrobiia bacterium]|nr:cyclic nucleotide-binding domain-containing protein [Acidimicrobiia bacterium]